MSVHDTDHPEDALSGVPDTRVRTLTEKGTELYSQMCDKYYQDIEYLWTMLDSMLKEADNPPVDLREQLVLEQKITQANIRYQKPLNAYKDFLKANRSENSQRDMETCSVLSNVRQRTIDAALHKIQEASQAITPRKTISNAPSGKSSSRSSKYLFQDGMSRRSDTSSLVKRKRAKAEALKASVAFAERQAALLKQEAQMEATAARRKAEMELKKAEIKADLTLLESRRIAAVAQTEARILEEDGSQTGAASQDQRSQLPEEEADPYQRVQDYVEEQSLSLTNQDAIANHDNAPQG